MSMPARWTIALGLLCVACGTSTPEDVLGPPDSDSDSEDAAKDSDPPVLRDTAPSLEGYAVAEVEVTPRVAAPPAVSEPSATHLRDEASARGLHALTGAYGRGTTFVDFDNDGWEDLWQSHAGSAPPLPSQRLSALWRNLGDGTFEPYPMPFTVDEMHSNWGSVWADFDEDGDADLIAISGGYNGKGLLGYYTNRVNEGLGFVKEEDHRGLSSANMPWWGAAEQDFDKDGLLDVIITGRALGAAAPCCVYKLSPENFSLLPGPVRLYRNNGAGFDDVTDLMGLDQHFDDGKNPTWWDFDHDGWPDLFLSNMGLYAATGSGELEAPASVKLYRNLEGQGFEDVTNAMLPTDNLRGPVFAAVATDINQDGLTDMYLGRHIFQDVVLLATEKGGFVVQGRGYGLDMGIGWQAAENTMGLGFGDLTADGHPEFMVGPGWPGFAGRGILYRHNGATGFERYGAEAPDLPVGRYHGVAMGDIDNDGDNDLFLNSGGFSPVDEAPWFWNVDKDGNWSALDTREYPLMMVNHEDVGRTATVRLQGTLSNRDAIGARIKVLGRPASYYEVPFTQGFQSRNSRWITLGTGVRSEVMVEVAWPSGVVTRNLVEAETRTLLIEPTE
ncbi:MAG: FG-GAP repeat domain-containing protein [Myxococcota bacterium]